MKSDSLFDSELAEIIGSSIKHVRIDCHWTQRDFAARLKSNLGAAQRMEAGRQRHLDSRLATSAMRLLGIRLTIDADPIGLAARREQRDAVHARCCAHVVGQLTRRGWDVRTEVEIGESRFRGWIDILAYRPADGALLVIEVKTEIHDFGRILRTLAWYARSALATARTLGWRPRRVVPALLVLATIEADARLAASIEQIRIELPGGPDALAAWIDDPQADATRPSLALIDPRSRGHDWLWRPRADGRRRPAPYADYRGAAQALNLASRRPPPRSPPRGRQPSS